LCIIQLEITEIKSEMKQLFLNAYEDYLTLMRKNVVDYDNVLNGHEVRRKQCKSLIDSINENFNFDNLVILETGSSSNYNDGMFGIFLGYLAKNTKGKMISVDISQSVVDRSSIVYKDVLPDLDYSIYVDDSVSFLNKIDQIPNLVHLDSYDFDLFNPLPSALHGWEEFKAIESKMPKGSIIIIDDNYRNGTWLEWIHADGRREVGDIRFPMLGKGAHVYQYVLNNKSDWELIGNHYETHDNIKIIIQKK
jgi:hypothetical protein